MIWNNFMIALPAPNQDILIFNERCKSTDIKSVERHFYTCQSKDYMKIIGENNMNMQNTFWTKITLPKQQI